mmetsp:Transcript_21772/g.28156  ORF Transcript_21772/g.28156 Transcript_21772/m.28156 type:complete len:107 (-) Transcript_21772:256-576(-)|eukprot:CAMPEP_0198137624 /NCGR_PEP_ID=MMETSP1443-20131203/1093_1 /TAXON_ID=186043 /ORGANISM="Entomoneis sp., Strain CCMP2396" /LENGTH=106 /DNA_ID=CAMNT_0043799121 /DNA_START=173 /DNA_END=493 /DNA_ORIENTATION=+
MQYENVTAIAKGNVYFDGKVVSHVIFLPSGEKKTMGVIQPGEYYFGTKAAELMEIAGGSCSVVLDGTTDSKQVSEGSSFSVVKNSGFTITVGEGEVAHYVCSYITE